MAAQVPEFLEHHTLVLELYNVMLMRGAGPKALSFFFQAAGVCTKLCVKLDESENLSYTGQRGYRYDKLRLNYNDKKNSNYMTQ